MVKKEEKGMNMVISTIKEGFKHLFSFKQVVDDIKHGFHEVLERSIKQLIANLLMLVGAVFIIIAILYFLMEYLQMNKTVTFLIGGIVIMFIALMMKYQLMKKEAY